MKQSCGVWASRPWRNLWKRAGKIRAGYGENKPITDDNYDKSLTVKCVNGTFVGKNTDDIIIAYKGIPFVGRQPVGEYRWKAPVAYGADDGIYEAYYNGKTPCQVEGNTA